jgi:FkbM family methyltransferase
MNWYGKFRIWWRAQRYLRTTEVDECRFVRESLQPGQAALDIGAHRAAYTYWMSRIVGPRGAVYAFEPQPALAEQLDRFASTCRHRNVRVCPVALSDHAGEALLAVPREFAAGATLEYGAVPAGTELLRVPLATLDDYLDAIQAQRPIALIKCDVELYELHVLRGGRRTLERDRPILLVESHALTGVPAAANATFDFLQQLGFQGYFFHHRELVPLASYRADVHEVTQEVVQNFVFLHPGEVVLASPRPPYAVRRLSLHARQVAA